MSFSGKDYSLRFRVQIPKRKPQPQQSKVRAHIYISGLVQGVFFRARTMQAAVRLGVKGWVRNLLDGRVEAVFEGEKLAVDAAIDYCRHGPEGAVVENVDVAWEPFMGEFDEFTIRHFNGD